jgi:apolipoprotein N-acyltransferase
VYPAVWLAGDLLQSLGYLAFPWNYLGYSQYPVLPIVQASSVIGILGVTFLVVTGNTLITEFISRNRDISGRIFQLRAYTWKRIPAVFFLIIIIIIAAGAFRLHNGIAATERRIRIATVQSCISPWADWERLKYMKLAEILALSNTVIPEKPDLLIWSESATLEPISFRSRTGQPDRFDKQILEYARTNKTPILTGEVGVVEDRKRMLGFPQNSAVLISAAGSVDGAYAKIHLCPFGEWFPFGDLFPWIRDIALQMGGSDFVPGKEPVRFFSGGASFGVLICYEGMFFRLPVHYKRAGADFLVNITNDGWSGSYGGHFQHFAAAPFRAAENGIWFVRVGNDGYTAVLDPLGRTTKSIPILEKGVMAADIHPDSKIETVYSRTGDLFSYCILGILALLCALFEIRLFIRKWKGQS